jgi:hypothetical protein
MTTQSSKKKNQNLAALLSDDADEIEKGITGGAGAKPEKKEGDKPESSGSGSDKGAAAQIKPAPEVKPVPPESEPEPEPARKDEPRMALEDELGLPKAFTRVFKKSGRYEKAQKTTTLVYVDILSHYRTLSEKMDVDTVVLVNNVLAEWYNKHLDVVDKVVNRKLDVKAL